MNNISNYTIRFLSVGAALLCTACPNPNTYTTPRTAAPGKISHSVAVEYWGYSVTDQATDTTVGGGVPTFPTYTLRVGVVDGLEIGGRLANLSSLGADVKWNFLKSEVFDVAIDPGFQWFSFSVSSTDGDTSQDNSLSVLYLHAPVLLGLNLSEAFSIVASPGISYGYATADVETTDAEDSASSSTGIMARFGLGFDFRISPKFAIHPEVTFLRTFDDYPATIYMAGIGFNFGNLPSYADLGGAAPASPKGE